MPEVYIPLSLIAVLLFAYFAVAFAVARHILFKKAKTDEEAFSTERDAGISEDEIFYPNTNTVGITSKTDRLALSGDIFLCKEESKRWVITLHGYGSQNATMGKYAKMFNVMGYNVLAVEHRNSGKSQGKYYTFGYKESMDCADWIEYLKTTQEVEYLGLFGISMGAATAILTAEKSKDVNFLIAYCSYSSYKAIIVHQMCKQMGNFSKVFYPGVAFASFVLTGLKSWKIRPDKSIKGVKCPTLILHSKADDFTPYTHSVEIHEGNENTEIHLFAKGRHARAYAADKDEYTRTVDNFLKETEKKLSKNQQNI